METQKINHLLLIKSQKPISHRISVSQNVLVDHKTDMKDEKMKDSRHTLLNTLYSYSNPAEEI